MVDQPTKNKPSHFTFIVVPHAANKGSLTLKVKSFWVYLGMGAGVFALVFVICSLVFSLAISRRLVDYKLTLMSNAQQKAQIQTFSKETEEIQSSIQELLIRDLELRKMLGLPGKPKSKIFSFDSKKSSYDLAAKMTLSLSDLKEELNERSASLDDLKTTVKNIRQRFAYTPSIWPIRGRILSKFGWRSYPWRSYHTGVDISAWYGQPIRAAAAGVVSFAGWRGDYGECVEINHGRGVSTLYGHSSRIYVVVGQKVAKGQLISAVGTSGLSTGPHLHYEVRRQEVPINPVAYLDINMFTASRIWNNY